MDAQSFLDQPVFTPGPEEITAASLSRIFTHFSTDAIGVGIAILTADRGDRAISLDESGVEVKDDQRNAMFNKKARKRLEGYLKSKGFKGWIVTKGGFKETGGDVVYENSYVVPGVSLEKAVQLAKVLGKGAKINGQPIEEKLKQQKSLENDFRQDAILWGSDKAGGLLIDFNGKIIQKLGKKFEPNTVQPYFTAWRKRRFAFGSTCVTLEYCPTSPSDYRQWRRELVTECMRLAAS